VTVKWNTAKSSTVMNLERALDGILYLEKFLNFHFRKKAYPVIQKNLMEETQRMHLFPFLMKLYPNRLHLL
jgi:hypothetical protein